MQLSVQTTGDGEGNKQNEGGNDQEQNRAAAAPISAVLTFNIFNLVLSLINFKIVTTYKLTTAWIQSDRKCRRH